MPLAFTSLLFYAVYLFKTFTKILLKIYFIGDLKEMELLDVIGAGNVHRCRIQPHEATTYSLQTDQLETFSAISTAELTLALKWKKKKQFSLLELPIGFSQKILSVVIIYFSLEMFLDLHLKV